MQSNACPIDKRSYFCLQPAPVGAQQLEKRPISRIAACKYTETLVVGAGAAGLTAAYFAVNNGAKVTVIERKKEAGKKILISGGTRCNVLPGELDLERDFNTESSKSALRAIFSSWELGACKKWLEDEVHLHLSLEAASKKLFPSSNSAKEVRDKLVAASRERGADFQYEVSLKGMVKESDGWICELTAGQAVHAQRVVMATGGLSFPHLGTDGSGLKLLETLGHTLHPPYPALTPLKGRHMAGSQLAGLSLYEASLQCKHLLESSAGQKGRRKPQVVKAERSALLFTHRGYSGPAVLDLSHHFTKSWERQEKLPEMTASWTQISRSDWERIIRASGGATVQKVLRLNGIPARLAAALTQELSISSKQAAQLTKSELQKLLNSLSAYVLDCTGHEGYPKAEVTGGGVRLEEVDCGSLESRRQPGLFLCGEVLDCFGRIGGFNFYWAWLTGRLAGLAASGSSI